MKQPTPRHVVPDPKIPGPANDAEEGIRIRKWHVNRVFAFLTGTTATCMATVAAVPNPAVLGAVTAIWAGSVILAMFLLAGAYRNRRLGETVTQALVDELAEFAHRRLAAP